MIYQLEDKRPTLLGKGHFIAPGAAVIGDVVLHENASVWFGCVLRGDADRIEVGAGSNIQDGTVMHADPGFPMTVGECVTIGHKAMLHGCTIGDRCLVGIQATILDGAVVGAGSIIGAGALVPAGREIPPNSLVLGMPGKVVRTLPPTAGEMHAALAAKYCRLHHNHRLG